MRRPDIDGAKRGVTSTRLAALLVVMLAGCRRSPDVAQSAPAPATTARTREKSPIWSPPSIPSASSVPSAAPSPTTAAAASAATTALPAADAFTAHHIQSLNEQLRARRVFRHLTLGRMPARARWLPSTRRRATGLSCQVTASQGEPHVFGFYDFPDDTARPMLFFSQVAAASSV